MLGRRKEQTGNIEMNAPYQRFKVNKTKGVVKLVWPFMISNMLAPFTVLVIVALAFRNPIPYYANGIYIPPGSVTTPEGTFLALIGFGFTSSAGAFANIIRLIGKKQFGVGKHGLEGLLRLTDDNIRFNVRIVDIRQVPVGIKKAMLRASAPDYKQTPDDPTGNINPPIKHGPGRRMTSEESKKAETMFAYWYYFGGKVPIKRLLHFTECANENELHHWRPGNLTIEETGIPTSIGKDYVDWGVADTWLLADETGKTIFVPVTFTAGDNYVYQQNMLNSKVNLFGKRDLEALKQSVKASIPKQLATVNEVLIEDAKGREEAHQTLQDMSDDRATAQRQEEEMTGKNRPPVKAPLLSTKQLIIVLGVITSSAVALAVLLAIHII